MSAFCRQAHVTDDLFGCFGGASLTTAVNEPCHGRGASATRWYWFRLWQTILYRILTVYGRETLAASPVHSMRISIKCNVGVSGIQRAYNMFFMRFRK